MLKVRFERSENYGDKPTWPPCIHASVLSKEDVLKAILSALDNEIEQVVLYSNSQHLLSYVDYAASFYEEEMTVDDRR